MPLLGFSGILIFFGWLGMFPPGAFFFFVLSALFTGVLVANSLVSITKQNLAAAIGMLEAAQRLQPQDQFIGILLSELRKYESGRALVNTDEKTMK